MIKEDFSLDEKYRQEASKATRKLYQILTKINFFNAPIKQVGFVKGNPTIPMIMIPGENINNQYIDLLIGIASTNNLPGLQNFTMSFEDGDKLIVISFNVPFQTIVLTPANFFTQKADGFYHEFIHYLDYGRRKKDTIKGTVSKKDLSKNIKRNHQELSDYFNTPDEYNAFTQTAFQTIMTALKKTKKKDLKNELNNFKSFFDFIQDFPSHSVQQIFHKTLGMFSFLNEKYKKKFLKRLYQFYIGVREKFLGQK